MSVLQIEESWASSLDPQAASGPDIKAAYLRLDDGAMVYDAMRLPQPGRHYFDPGYWKNHAEVLPVPGGRGQVQRIGLAGQDWILRHFRRGGWMGRLTEDRYLWTGLIQSRPWREWHLLYDLYRGGLPVPRPIAAQVQRVDRWWYRADMITERLDASPLSLVLQGQDIPEGLWRRVGAQINQFHRAGIYHADLNLDNILVDREMRVFLLDFDKGWRRKPRLHWQRANLRRLRHSLIKALGRYPGLMFGSADWKRLLDGYAGGSSRA